MDQGQKINSASITRVLECTGGVVCQVGNTAESEDTSSLGPEKQFTKLALILFVVQILCFPHSKVLSSVVDNKFTLKSHFGEIESAEGHQIFV